MPESRVILTCPACSVRYRSRREIGPRGARVTCPGCRHTFVFFPGEGPKAEPRPTPVAQVEAEAITATRIPAAAEASLPDGHFASVFDRPTLAEIQLYEPDGEETEPEQVGGAPATPIEDDHTSPSSPLSRQAISLLSRSRSHESGPPEPVVGLKRVPRLPAHIEPVTPDAMEASVWEAELGVGSVSGRPPAMEASWRPEARPPTQPMVSMTGLSIAVVGLVLLAFFACAGLGAGAGLLAGDETAAPAAAAAAYPPPSFPAHVAGGRADAPSPAPTTPDLPPPPAPAVAPEAEPVTGTEAAAAPAPEPALAVAASPKPTAAKPAAKPVAKAAPPKPAPKPSPNKPSPAPAKAEPAPAGAAASAKPAITADSTSDLVDPWAR